METLWSIFMSVLGPLLARWGKARVNMAVHNPHTDTVLGLRRSLQWTGKHLAVSGLASFDSPSLELSRIEVGSWMSPCTQRYKG